MNEESELIHHALGRAYYYLKFRPRSEKEVRDYLTQKAEKFHWPVTVVEEAVTSLKEQNYINDADFIEWFVHQRSSGKPKSSFALTHELHRFGVSKEDIQHFFNKNPLNEDNLAFAALEKRWPRYKNLDKKQRFQKAAAFLSQRGFSFDLIKKSIEQLENEAE
jgi:regulatory protein